MMIIDNNLLLEQIRSLSSNVLIQIFVLLVVFDVLTGITKGFFIKDANSKKGVLGVVKNLLIIVLVLVAVPYLELLGFHLVGVSLKVFFIAQYGLSIVENLGEIGIPFPEWVTERLTKLKNDNNKKDNE